MNDVNPDGVHHCGADPRIGGDQVLLRLQNIGPAFEQGGGQSRRNVGPELLRGQQFAAGDRAGIAALPVDFVDFLLCGKIAAGAGRTVRLRRCQNVYSSTDDAVHGAANAGLEVIVYDLSCENSHRFEGWFDSSADYERQLAGKLLTCPLCGSGRITKLPHASYVNTGGGRDETPVKAVKGAKQHYANFSSEVLAKLVDYVIENTEDVGPAFPEEARKIHYQEAPERRIRGTASTQEVEALKEEGIEVVALPIPLHRVGKTH